MELDYVYNDNGLAVICGDCFTVMRNLIERGVRVDVILTSPPYNSNKQAGCRTTIQESPYNAAFKRWYGNTRYDLVGIDNKTTEEYAVWTANIFTLYDRILKPNGVVIYNLSWGSLNPNDWIYAVHAIVDKTNFTYIDGLAWIKSSSMPITSSNKLSRRFEPIYIFCRKGETRTFHANKKVSSIQSNGKKIFQNIQNIIKAPNNDKANDLNLATFSSDLCVKLLNLYAPKGSTVLDTFAGTGTTLIACVKLGLRGIGIELSEAQCKYAMKRIKKLFTMGKREALIAFCKSYTTDFRDEIIGKTAKEIYPLYENYCDEHSITSKYAINTFSRAICAELKLTTMMSRIKGSGNKRVRKFINP